MRRVIRGSAAPFQGTDKIIDREHGGTGVGTAEAAAEIFGVVSLHKLNKPNGYAGIDPVTGKISKESFGVIESNIVPMGFSIDGPLQLYHGQQSRYFLTEWIRNQSHPVSVDVGSVSISGREIIITAPSTGTEVNLTIGPRTVTIPIVSFAPVAPAVTYPRNNSKVPRDFKISTDRYLSLPVFYGSWVTVTEVYTLVTVPAGVSAIEIEGKKGSSGQAYVEVDGERYSLFSSTSRRRVKLTGQTKVLLNFQSPGSIKYRFVSCSSTHVSTDWQVATDAAFTTIVRSSSNNAVDKTTHAVSLPAGKYYARVRYKGSIAF